MLIVERLMQAELRSNERLLRRLATNQPRDDARFRNLWGDEAPDAQASIRGFFVFWGD